MTNRTKIRDGYNNIKNDYNDSVKKQNHSKSAEYYQQRKNNSYKKKQLLKEWSAQKVQMEFVVNNSTSIFGEEVEDKDDKEVNLKIPGSM